MVSGLYGPTSVCQYLPAEPRHVWGRSAATRLWSVSPSIPWRKPWARLAAVPRVAPPSMAMHARPPGQMSLPGTATGLWTAAVLPDAVVPEMTNV